MLLAFLPVRREMGLHESAYIFIDEMDMLIILYI